MDTNFISTVLNKKSISIHFAVKLVVGERGEFYTRRRFCRQQTTLLLTTGLCVAFSSQFSVSFFLSSRVNVSFLTYVSVQSTSTGSHVGKPRPHMYWDEACTETSSEAVMRWLVYFIQRMIWLASSVCERQGCCCGSYVLQELFNSGV